MPDRRDVDRLNKAQDKAVALAVADLDAVLKRLDGAAPEQIRDVLLEVMPALVAKWGEVAAAAAADWYNTLRSQEPDLPPFTANLAAGLDGEAARATTRRLAGSLWTDTPDVLGDALTGNIGMWLKNRARMTVADAVDSDPAKPGWARVPRGAKTCAYCTMLASRGFVYSQKATAAASGHRHCDCQIVPNFGKHPPKIKDYDPDRYKAGYEIARQSVIDEGRKPDTESVLVAMRDLFPDSYTDGHTSKDKGASGDRSLFQGHYRQYRRTLASRLLDMSAEERRGKRLPPSALPQAPTEEQWPSDLPTLSARTWKHILYGDRRGGAHLHGHGWVTGGDEFPEEWDVSDVLAAAEYVIRSSTRQPGTRRAEASYRGVRVRVAYDDGKLITITPVKEAGR